MSVVRFEKMRLDEVSSKAIVTPWPAPAFNVPMMPSGLLPAALEDGVPVQLSHMFAAQFACQMAATAEIAITWALDQARAFHVRTLPEFGALLNFAEAKARQQGLYESLMHQLAAASGVTVPDFSAKRRDLAAKIMKADPLARKVFVLEATWASEWASDRTRKSRYLTHPALPTLMATERRMDAEVRGALKIMIEATAGACDEKSMKRAADDLRMIHIALTDFATDIAATFCRLTEIAWGTEPFARDAEHIAAVFECAADHIWMRPTARLPRLVEFLSSLDQGDRLLWMKRDSSAEGEDDMPFLATSA